MIALPNLFMFNKGLRKIEREFIANRRQGKNEVEVFVVAVLMGERSSQWREVRLIRTIIHLSYQVG